MGLIMQLTKSQKSNLKQARTMLENILKECPAVYASDDIFNSPCIVVDYLKSRIALEEKEVFSVLFLDNQNRLIKTEELFSGTFNSVVIYPREIIKQALLNNADSIIIAHNHPSGDLNASNADRKITAKIKKACDLMDIRLLDHIIVSKKGYYSF